MVAWAAAEAFEKWPRAQQTFKAVAVVVCAGWLLVTWVQIKYWKDSAALYTPGDRGDGCNYLAHLNLGVDLAAQGRYQAALGELYTSIEQNPDQPHARNSLGGVLYNLGRKDEAIEQFSQAIRLAPQDAEPHCNLGNALVDSGKIDDAIQRTQYGAAFKSGDGECLLRAGSRAGLAKPA